MSYILITGASEGIGFELAKICAERGHDLLLIARNEQKLIEIQKSISAANKVNVLIFPIDLMLPGSAEQIALFVTDKKIIVDTLINNAGIGLLGDFAAIGDWNKHREIITLNIMALTELTHRFIPLLSRQKKARIMNISSTAAFMPGPGMAVYYATKAFVNSFSLALKHELKNTGIDVTVFCPGPVATKFQERAGMQNSRLVRSSFMADPAKTANIAYSAMINGKSIHVSGLMNKMMIFASKFLPVTFLVIIVSFIQKKTKERS